MKSEAVRKHKPRVKKGTTEKHNPPVRVWRTRTALLAAAAGVVVGSLILYFHPFNDIFVKHIRSERATFINWYPTTFQFLNGLCGISLVTFSVACLIYTLYWKEEIDSFLNKHYRGALFFLIGAMGILAFFVCYHKFFDIDEIEHIHSAWYIKNGYIPYRDFFEHHNPLLWYSLLPFLYLGGDSANTILLARLFMFCITLGIIYCAYLIAFTVSKSKETGIVSAVLMFSSVLFMEKSIEIRPDTPQVLFGMISLYFLIRFIQSRDNYYCFFSGLSAAISFLFLQKAIFLIIAYAVIFAYALFKREISVKSALYFMGGFLAPLFLFSAYLQITGSLHDYFLTNWQLNRVHLGARGINAKPIKPMTNSLIPNFPFWILAVTSVFYLFLKQKICKEMKVIVFVGLVQICSMALFSTAFKHYYLFPISLLSVSGAYFLTNMFAAGKIITTHRVALAGLIMLWALPFLLIDNMNSNRFQLEKIKYVLSMTKDTDLVYDGANNFNLFRHDLHYFWFQLGQLNNYNALSDGRFGDYDGCALIRAKMPKIVNELHLDVNLCGVGALYDKTKYPGVYIRKEE